VTTGLNHISQTGKQKVKTSTQNPGEESFSNWETVNSGLPQDSVLNLYK
jgi:hypothetical protein